MKKRILAFVLALLMVFSLLPVTAFADEKAENLNTEVTEETTKQSVEIVNEIPEMIPEETDPVAAFADRNEAVVEDDLFSLADEKVISERLAVGLMTSSAENKTVNLISSDDLNKQYNEIELLVGDTLAITFTARVAADYSIEVIRNDGVLDGTFPDKTGSLAAGGKHSLNVTAVKSGVVYITYGCGNEGASLKVIVKWLGEGTADDPYQLYNAGDMIQITDSIKESRVENNYEGVYFSLMNDIPQSAPLTQPIGVGSYTFNGNFDGNGHTVWLAMDTTSNLNQVGGSHQGLFGWVENASIKNVTVEGVVKGGDTVAGICALSEGIVTIENCVNHATVESRGATGMVGGILGSAYNGLGGSVTIRNCVNTGAISWNKKTDGTSLNGQYAGGIIGSGAKDIYIENCYSVGSVTGTAYYAIGRFGQSAVVKIINCYGNGTLYCEDKQNVVTVKNSYQYGDAGSACYITPDNAKLASGADALATKLNSGLISGYKPWAVISGQNGGYPVFGAHDHSFNYSASGAVLTATCTDGDCYLPEKKLTLTLTKDYATDIFSDWTAFDVERTLWNGFGAAPVTINYYASTDTSFTAPLDGKPTEPGDYVVRATAGGAAVQLAYTLAAPYWYIDENGEKQSLAEEPTIVESSSQAVTWKQPCYFVPAGESLTLTAGVNQTVNSLILILADGADLTITDQFWANKKSIIVYGQTEGTGKLTIQGSGATALSIGDIAVYGGIASFQGGEGKSWDMLAGGYKDVVGFDGVAGNLIVGGNAKVTVTGGKGGTSRDGGSGVNGTVAVKDQGQLTLIGGAGNGSGKNGVAFKSSNENMNAKVKVSTDGTTWTDWNGTAALNTFRYLKLASLHDHSFTYAVGEGGDALTATCSKAGCPLTDGKLTLTLTDDLTANAAAVKAWNDEGAATAAIKYYAESDTEFKTPLNAPVKSGKYVAKATADGKTAQKEINFVSPYYYINEANEKADPETPPTIAETKTGDVTWNGTIFVPAGETKITGKVTLGANVSLILADGADLTITGGISDGAGVSGARKLLTVYRQTKGTGKLTVSGAAKDNIYYIGVIANLTVNGGNIDIDVNPSTNPYGVYGNVTVNGGSVNISCKEETGNGTPLGVQGNVTVNGGIVAISVTGKDGGHGVERGTVTVNGGDVTITATAASPGMLLCGVYMGNGVTVNGGSLKVFANGNTDYGYGIEKANITVTGKGEVTLYGSSKAVHNEKTVAAKVKTSNDGTSWTKLNNVYDISNYKYLRLTVNHDHDFTYEVSQGGDAITATCSKADCPLKNRQMTLTLTDDPTANAAAVQAWNDEGAATATLNYYAESDTQFKTPITPENLAKNTKYVAKVTAGGKTASLEFELLGYNSKGSGTAEDPWLISNLYQLTDLANAVNKGNNMSNKYFKLTADIGSSTNGLTTPIAYASSIYDLKPFSGTFDGNGKTVYLNITVDGGWYLGLFGCLYNGTIKNVNTAGSVIGQSSVGGVCGYLDNGIIENCCNSAVVKCNGMYLGGVCGYVNSGKILNCGNSGTVNGTGGLYIGGVCGFACGEGKIEILNCSNSGSVTGGSNVGGVCGFFDCDGAISNCYTAGSVTGGDYVGGVCGYFDCNGAISNCYTAGSVTGGSNVGGVCGYCDSYDNMTFTNCYYPSGMKAYGDGSPMTQTNCSSITDTDMKLTSGDNALVTKLNNYKTGNPAQYPADWMIWEIKSGVNNGYPVLVDPHTHAFTYSADENVLTAKCTEGCTEGYDTNPFTLTLTAPADADLAYNGNAKEIGFADGEAAAWKTAIGTEAPTVTYYLKGGETLTYADDTTNKGKAPKEAGTYVAKITAGEATASLTFSIYSVQIGTNYYTSIEDALTAAATGNTVKLLTGVTAEAALEVIDGVTLDLGKNTLTLDGKTLTLSGSATGVTVTNGTVDGAADTIIVSGKAEIKNDVIFAGTLKLANSAALTLPGTIELKAKQNDTKLTYDKATGKIKLTSGQFGFGKTTKTAVFVDVTGADDMKVEITPAAASGISVKKDTAGASVCGAGSNDTVVIGGVSYAPVSGKDIPVVVPHKPFPSASSVTIPKELAATVNINVNTAADNGPTVATAAANKGSVKIVPDSTNVLPATVTVAASGDTVTVDPDGVGATAGTPYKTTATNTVITVDANGVSTLTAGGIELDKGENVLIKNADGTKTVTVAVPADTDPTAKVSATATAGTYTVSIPVGGAIEIGGAKYTNEGSAEATLKVTVGADGTPVVEITSGTIGVPNGKQVKVGDRKIDNATGNPIKVSTDGSVAIGGNQLTYTGNATGVKFTKEASGEIVATMNDTGAKLVVKPVASGDADVKVTNGNAYALVKADSAGTLKVEKTATGLTATVTGDNSNPTKIEMGGTQYTVPAGKNATFTTTASGALPTLTSGSTELDNTESVIVDGMTVKNTTGAVLTVTETTAGDGKFDLTSGSDTFHYTKASSDTDLTVTKNNGTLQFVLDAIGESVSFTNTQTTEFSNGTNVFVTADGGSKGDVTVNKIDGGFETLIDNSKVTEGTSTVTVGGTTYTVPASTTTKLSVSTYNGVATMSQGTVTMPTTGKVDVRSGDKLVEITNDSGKDMTVQLNADGTLTITVSGAQPIVYTRPENSGSTLVFRASDTDNTIQLEQKTVGEKLSVPAGQGIKLYDSSAATDPIVSVTAGGGSKVDVEHTDTTAFTATVASNNSKSTDVKVGKETYTVPKDASAKLSTTGAEATATLISGSVELDGTGAGEEIFVDGVTVTNTSGAVLTVTETTVGDGKFDLKSGIDTFNYTKAAGDADLLVTTNNGTLQFVLDAVGETVEFDDGTNTQTAEFSDGEHVFVTVDGSSTGKAKVVCKGSDGFVTEIDNEATETSTVKAGGTTYEIPANTRITMSIATYDGVAKMTEAAGAATVPDKGKVTADGVTVENTTGAKLTVIDNESASDGEFDLKTANGDSFHYTNKSDDDLTVTKNAEGALQFVLDATGETVAFSGTKTQNTEFTDEEGHAYIAVDKDSEGTVTVEKTADGYLATIINGNDQETVIRVGGTTYTVPANTTTKLSVKEVYGVDGTAFMLDDEGAVIFENGTVYVDNVFVTNGSGEALKVTDNEETAGDDGDLTLNSGNNEYHYFYATDAYDAEEAASDIGSYKFTFTKVDSDLQFVLDTDAIVKFDGTETETTTEFSPDGTNVFVTVDGESKGTVTVVKTSSGFDTEIVNGAGQTSTVTAGGGTEYTVPVSTTTKLSVADAEGVAEMSQGTVTMPDGGKVDVLSGDKLVNVTNGSGKDLTITLNADGTLTATVKDAQAIVYTRPENSGSTLVFRASEADGTIKLEQKTKGEKLSVPAGQGIKLYDGNSEAATDPIVSVTTGGGSKVDVEHTDTTAFTATVTTNNSVLTNMQMGKTTFSVPVKTTSKISVASVNDTPALLESDGAVTFGKGTFYVDSVYVDNKADETFTIKDDKETSGDNGDFTVTSSKNEKYIYHTAKDYKADAAVGTFDLAIRNGTNTGDLCFTMDDTGEWLKIPGEIGTTAEFDNASGEVCVTVDGSSTGDVTVTKGSFEVLVENDKGETSYVTVGKHTYTVPESKTTLRIATDDPALVATLDSGIVKLDQNEEVILKTTGDPYSVKNTDDAASVLLVNNDGDKGVAQLELPANGAVTFVNKQQYSTLKDKSAKLTATYVEDGTGDVTISGQKGVKLVLNEGGVVLTNGEKIHTNSITPAQITNPNSSTIDVEIDAEAGSVTKDDTVITLAKGQRITVGETDYTAQNNNTKIAVDHTTGKPKLIIGGIEMGQGNSIKIDNWTVEVPEGGSPITVGIGTNGGDPSEIGLSSGGKMTITAADDNEYVYVNNSKNPVTPRINADGQLTLILPDTGDPINLPAGSYESINIRATGEKQTTYTFEDDLDSVLAKENVAAGDVIVINTDLPTPPSTGAYVLTADDYDIYGVGGNLAKQGKEGTDYEPEYYTVDANERADYYGVSDMADSLASCMVVRVDAGVVTVQAGEARIVWSKNDTTYYPTLEDALYDASHTAGGGNSYNTHNGRLTNQTILMNINPYADRENIDIEVGDRLVTCGEDPTKTGDTYIAMMDSHITMYANSNDLYLVDGSLTGEAGKQDTDNTVTVFVAGKNAGYYAQSKSPIIVTASPFTSGLAAVKTTLPLQTVTVGLGNGVKRNNTGLLAGENFSITRVGQVIEDVVDHEENIAAVIIKTVVKAVTNVIKSIFKR